MKYRAGKLSSGKYAVFCGRTKYFTNTVSESLSYAKEQAILMSISWYDQQAREAFDKLCKTAERENRLKYCDRPRLLKPDGSVSESTSEYADILF